jgi:hypothetical protein
VKPRHLSWCSNQPTTWKFQGSNSSRIQILFSSPNHPNPLWGPHSRLLNRYSSYFQGVNWPGLGVSHTFPFSAEVKVGLSCTCAPIICRHGVCRDSITATFSKRQKDSQWNFQASIFRTGNFEWWWSWHSSRRRGNTKETAPLFAGLDRRTQTSTRFKVENDREMYLRKIIWDVTNCIDEFSQYRTMEDIYEIKY